jgi:hypothetical protein
MKAKRKENCIGDVTGYTKAGYTSIYKYILDIQVIVTPVHPDVLSAKRSKQTLS